MIFRQLFPRFHCYRSYHTFILDNISSYGTLHVKCPRVDAHVKCINPHQVPNGDKSFITLKSPDEAFDLTRFDIEYEKENSIISISNSKGEIPDGTSIHIEVPHIYDLNIDAYSVNIEETEGDNVTVNSTNQCNLGKIKSLNTNIFSGASVMCKNLLGDGTIQVAENISVKKVQSKKLDLGAKNVDISALYCLDFKLTTENGNVNIGSLHGSGDISSNSGDVTVTSSSTDLRIVTDSGNVDVTVEQCGQVHVQSSCGDIEVGLGDRLSAFIEAEGKHIDVPEDLLVDGMKEHSSSGYQRFEGRFGDGNTSSIDVKTVEGNITFCRKDWFSKFKFES